MSSPLCQKVSIMNTEDQKKFLLVLLWSFRQRMRTIPGFATIKVSIRSSFLIFGDPESERSLILTSMPVDDNNGLLKKIADCLNITASQSNEMALTVMKSFCDARAEKCQHAVCMLIKALIPESDVFLVDRSTILTSDNQLLFVPAPGTENVFLSLLQERIVEKKPDPVVF